MPGEKILVTGGLGAIGSFVTRHFIENGYSPIVFDSRPDFSLVSDLKEQFELVLGDIMDFPALSRIVKENKIKRVAHMAALMPDICQSNPSLGWRVNADGTINMLELARTFGIERLVFASSSAVYADKEGKYSHPDYVPISEDYPKNPSDVYGVTKLVCELMAQQYHANYGLPYVALRFAATYGPGKLARHGRVGMHSRLIEDAMSGIPIKHPQGADQPDDMVYNRDVGLGVFLAVTKSDVKSGSYNIGSGRMCTLNDMAKALKEFIEGAIVEIGPGLDYYGNNTRYYGQFDITRASEMFDYKPIYDIRAGIKDYIELMNELGLSRSPE